MRRVAFLSAHRRREIQGVSLRARLCRSVRREVFPPREAVAERPVLFIKRGESPDDIAVDQRAQDRPPLPAGRYAHFLEDVPHVDLQFLNAAIA